MKKAAAVADGLVFGVNNNKHMAPPLHLLVVLVQTLVYNFVKHILDEEEEGGFTTSALYFFS
jgi:hypothetical protein